jgi:hypothetical protein
MHNSAEISTKQEALIAVKQNAASLSRVSSTLKSEISFAWEISRIQSEMNDELRKKYINRFLIQESLKLFASFAIVVVSGFIIVGVFVLPMPFLVAVTLGPLLAAISGFYAINKIVQHAKGYFKVSENREASSTTTAENPVESIGMRQKLSDEILRQTQIFAGECALPQLALVSKKMHSIFRPANQVFNKFLQCVAFGQQDKAEQLFRVIYSGNPVKIQEALRFQGIFTDYSGRIFNCSAYEYAYWAKDTHMCRMLERYMDEETKALILARITTNDEIGLSYQQNWTVHRSPHFDLNPLIAALQALVTSNLDAIDAARQAVGMAQCDVPAHVAQEYCRHDRSFGPCPNFGEASLPRVLDYFNDKREDYDYWYPLSRDICLGRDFAVFRNRGVIATSELVRDYVNSDLAAITQLDKVRTADLTLSREHLAPARSPSMSI